MKAIIAARYAAIMAKFIYERAHWPEFAFDQAQVSARLAAARHQQGRLIGRMQSLGFFIAADASLRNLTEEIVKSNEIEGEPIDREQVRSSVARRLGIEIGALVPADRNVEGVVEMMLDATQKYDERLTKARLLAWHAALFPTGRSGMLKIATGAWRNDRTGPMRVVSGPIGRETVHFVAPAAGRIDGEMKRFLAWFNHDDATDLVLKSAIAHLWFLTIHPFDDGNGRIARAMSDLLLARSEQSSQRFYSMSAQIRKMRREYYAILESTQKGDLDITRWIEWFFACLEGAFMGAESTIEAVLSKARFWERVRDLTLNDRQRSMLNKLIDGFEGKLTTSKWALLMKTSTDTALRDIEALVAAGILKRADAGGRSTNYILTED